MSIFSNVLVYASSERIAATCRVHFRYGSMLHHRLFQITPADYDEFVGYLFHAKLAFTWSSEGTTSFNHLLAIIKR